MNVTPANSRPHVLPSLDGWQSLRDSKQEGEPFGNVLAAVLRSEPGAQTDHLGGQPPRQESGAGIEAAVPLQDRPKLEHDGPIAEIPPGAAMDYRPALKDGTPAAIGDDAVRFDARPVVGRSFVAQSATETASPGSAQSAGRFSADIELAMLELKLEPDLHRAITQAAARVQAMASGLVSRATAALAPAGQAGNAAKNAGTWPIAAVVQPRAGLAGAPESSAAASPEFSRNVRTNIALTLLADEVLITVRGLDLSADEEEALADEARRLLASSDFGGRTLRVVTSRRA